MSCTGRRLFRWEADGLTYRTATPDDSEAVWRLMTTEFYPRTALCHCLELSKPEDFEASHALMPQIMEEGVSLVVEDSATQQLIGARLSGVERREDSGLKHPLVADPALSAKYPKYGAIYRMFDQLTSSVDLFQRYDVGRLMAFKFLVVAESHGGRGIATKLVQYSLEVAKELKLELVSTFTGSRYSERIYESLGFDRLEQLRIPDFEDPVLGGRPFGKLNTAALEIAVLFAKRV